MTLPRCPNTYRNILIFSIWTPLSLQKRCQIGKFLEKAFQHELIDLLSIGALLILLIVSLFFSWMFVSFSRTSAVVEGKTARVGDHLRGAMIAVDEKK